MQVNFTKSGDKVFLSKAPEGDTLKFLEPKIYSVNVCKEGLYLNYVSDSYSLPPKLYGDFTPTLERITKTYFERSTSTGILLSGLKGTGKTLLVRSLCNIMLGHGIPVIQVTRPIDGSELFPFIELIGECVVLIDEFAKLYPWRPHGESPQNSLLTMLDGLSNSKRLHLLTENSTDHISPFILDRPGRAYYHFKYTRLKENMIREYCVDNNIPKEVVNEIMAVSYRAKSLSFDSLKAIVDEWLRFGGPIVELVEALNISLISTKRERYKLKSVISEDGRKFDITGNTIIGSLDGGDDDMVLTFPLGSEVAKYLEEKSYNLRRDQNSVYIYLTIESLISIKGETLHLALPIGLTVAIEEL